MKITLPKIIIFLILVNFLLRIPFLNLPAHFDEINYFNALLAIYNNHFNPFVVFYSYKPPVDFIIPAIFFKLFGPARIWGRLATAAYSSLVLLFNYLLAKRVFNHRVAIFSTVLLFCFPMFMVQSFLFQGMVSLTALTLASVYFYFSRQKKLYFLTASLLVLDKETAIFILIFLAAYDFLINIRKRRFTDLIKQTIFLISPIGWLVIWMLINKFLFSWFLWPTHLAFYETNNFMKLILSYSLDYILIENPLIKISGMLIGLCIIITVLSKKYRQRLWKKENSLFLSLFFFYSLFYTYGYFIPRYLLFVYPLYFMVFSQLIIKLFPKKTYILVLLMVFAGGLLLSNYFSIFRVKQFHWVGDVDFGLFGKINLQQKTLNYLNNNFQESIVLSNWLIAELWRQPFFGYTKKEGIAFDFSQKDNREIITNIINYQDKKPILLVIASDYDRPVNYLLSFDWELIQTIKLDNLKESQEKFLIFRLKQ